MSVSERIRSDKEMILEILLPERLRIDLRVR
jgi:hypothetical protein